MIHGHVSLQLADALPPEVVDALGLLPGDAIEYVIQDGAVRISRSADHVEADLGLTAAQLDALIQESLDDPRPSVPLDEAFDEVFALIERKRQERG